MCFIYWSKLRIKLIRALQHSLIERLASQVSYTTESRQPVRRPYITLAYLSFRDTCTCEKEKLKLKILNLFQKTYSEISENLVT